MDINWNVVNKLTNTLYVLMLIFLFINPIWSMVLLFAIVSLWSRIPGTATPVFGDWLLMLDLVDMFSVIIAINLGGVKGALFSIIINFVSGATGSHTNWIFVIKDIIAVSLTCLLIPYVYLMTGDIVMTISLFTLIRALWFFPLQVIMPLFEFNTFLGVMVVWTTGLYIVNLLYAKMFGSFFDSLLKTGVGFNWPLFLGVTAIVFGTRMYQKYIGIKKSENIQTRQGYGHSPNLYRMS